jgi:hypothetical protein
MMILVVVTLGCQFVHLVETLLVVVVVVMMRRGGGVIGPNGNSLHSAALETFQRDTSELKAVQL